MSLPFTSEEFFEVFARYNRDVWPAQLVLYAMAVAAVFSAARSKRHSSALVISLLAFFWLWMGAVYHLRYFSTINRAAFGFGFLFMLQSFIFIAAGIRSEWREGIQFRFRRDARGIVGAALIAYALIFYPVIGWMAGHRYPATPTFGLPCPTTIFTCGLCLWTVDPLPWRFMAIPLIWAIIGFFAAVWLSVIEDAGLLVAGLVLVSFTASQKKSEIL